MSKTHCDISMSLDGFITGPEAGVGNPLGEDEGLLHAWMFESKTDADDEVLAEAYERTGAIILGKRMFDVGVEPWGDPPPFERPVIVLTHEARAPMEMQGGTTYQFNNAGVESALAQAKEAAGSRDVGIWGGGDVIRQVLVAGLLDEIQIHLAPILLGDGVPLFAGLPSTLVMLERTRTIATPAATHLRFEVVR